MQYSPLSRQPDSTAILLSILFGGLDPLELALMDGVLSNLDYALLLQVKVVPAEPAWWSKPWPLLQFLVPASTRSKANLTFKKRNIQPIAVALGEGRDVVVGYVDWTPEVDGSVSQECCRRVF